RHALCLPRRVAIADRPSSESDRVARGARGARGGSGTVPLDVGATVTAHGDDPRAILRPFGLWRVRIRLLCPEGWGYFAERIVRAQDADGAAGEALALEQARQSGSSLPHQVIGVCYVRL